MSTDWLATYWVDLAGAAGSIVAFAMWLPQARRTWSRRHDPAALAAISTVTQALVVLNATIWVLYAAGTGAWWPAAPGLVSGPLAIGTIWLIERARAAGPPHAPTRHGHHR